MTPESHIIVTETGSFHSGDSISLKFVPGALGHTVQSHSTGISYQCESETGTVTVVDGPCYDS